MTRAILFLKAAIPILLLAVVAPSTTGLQADTTKKTPAPPPAYSVLTVLSSQATQPAVEHLPKSQLAWAFSTLPDGTKVISGPNGTIWRGQIEVSRGPYDSNSKLLNDNDQASQEWRKALQQYYQALNEQKQEKGQSQSTPAPPNLAPILPPGHSQPHFILPKLTP